MEQVSETASKLPEEHIHCESEPTDVMSDLGKHGSHEQKASQDRYGLQNEWI